MLPSAVRFPSAWSLRAHRASPVRRANTSRLRRAPALGVEASTHLQLAHTDQRRREPSRYRLLAVVLANGAMASKPARVSGFDAAHSSAPRSTQTGFPETILT